MKIGIVSFWYYDLQFSVVLLDFYYSRCDLETTFILPKILMHVISEVAWYTKHDIYQVC